MNNSICINSTNTALYRAKCIDMTTEVSFSDANIANDIFQKERNK